MSVEEAIILATAIAVALVPIILIVANRRGPKVRLDED